MVLFDLEFRRFVWFCFSAFGLGFGLLVSGCYILGFWVLGARGILVWVSWVKDVFGLWVLGFTVLGLGFRQLGHGYLGLGIFGIWEAGVQDWDSELGGSECWMDGGSCFPVGLLWRCTIV